MRLQIPPFETHEREESSIPDTQVTPPYWIPKKSDCSTYGLSRNHGDPNIIKSNGRQVPLCKHPQYLASVLNKKEILMMK